jgi:Berberine and berberine like
VGRGGRAAHERALPELQHTDPRPERLHEAFPGATLERLRELKAVYDPDDVFDQNTPIPPKRPIAAAA